MITEKKNNDSVLLLQPYLMLLRTCGGATFIDYGNIIIVNLFCESFSFAKPNIGIVSQSDKACAIKREDTVDVFSSKVFRIEMMCLSLLKSSSKTSAFILICKSSTKVQKRQYQH